MILFGELIKGGYARPLLFTSRDSCVHIPICCFVHLDMCVLIIHTCTCTYHAYLVEWYEWVFDIHLYAFLSAIMFLCSAAEQYYSQALAIFEATTGATSPEVLKVNYA